MEGVYECGASSQVEVKALMGGRFYEHPYDFDWRGIQTKSGRLIEVKEFVKRFVYPLYLPGRLWQCIQQVQRHRIPKEILKRGQYDILHAHDFASVLFLREWSLRFAKPLIFTNHAKGSAYRESLAYSYPYYRTALWKKHFQEIEMEAIRVSDILTFPSESAMELLLNDYPRLEYLIRDKAKIIYTGIPDPKAHLEGTNSSNTEGFSSTRNLIVVNIGNHIPDKGVDIALRTFRILVDMSRLNLQFVNMGMHGPETNRLYLLAQELRLADRVLFVGVVPFKELLKILNEAFVALHTPRKVVFDLSLLEIMGLGKPVIATLVKGNLEALGITYPLFVSPNSPTLSQDQVNLLLSESRSIGNKLRSRYEANFTLCKMVERYVNLWNSTIQPT
jgi:glycosyltransferase involved in cell wall biosynthesis